MAVKGFKVFRHDWTCRSKQYACPGKFEEDVIPEVCEQGMHFCEKVVDCFNYYCFDPTYKVAEVIAYGTVVKKCDMSCTDRLEIVREIPWAELLELVNMGKGCSGRGNFGDHNSGDWNTGDCNSGDFNTDDCNSGDRNTGDCNSGDWNTGNCNFGDWNSGDFNAANGCSGCFNTADQKIVMFNQSTDWTQEEWRKSEAYVIICRIFPSPVQWIPLDDMSDAEKREHSESETTGGYLKTLSKEEQAKLATQNWHKLSDDQKHIILSLPNFDREIFKQITGIDVGTAVKAECETKGKEEDRTYMVTEWCSSCDSEIEMRWDTDVRGFQAICPICGEKLMLCNECRHAPDGGKCDYSDEQGGCWRSKK